MPGLFSLLSVLISKIILPFIILQHFVPISPSVPITLPHSCFLSTYLLGPQFTHTHSHITSGNRHTLYSEILGTKTFVCFNTSVQAKYQTHHGHSLDHGYRDNGWTHTNSSTSYDTRMELNCTHLRSASH